MKLVAGREVGVDQLEKFLTDVGLYCLAEWRVEPNGISSPLSSLGGSWIVFEHMIMATPLKSLLVVPFCIIKYGF